MADIGLEQVAALKLPIPDASFANLQQHVAALPQELQDEILTCLFRLYLQVGTIALDLYGTNHRFFLPKDENHNTPSPMSPHRSSNPQSRLFIMGALNKYWLQRAKQILYCDNVWKIPVLATFTIQSRFFKHWHPEDLRLLPRFMLIVCKDEITPWRRRPASELMVRLQRDPRWFIRLPPRALANDGCEESLR